MPIYTCPPTMHLFPWNSIYFLWTLMEFSRLPFLLACLLLLQVATAQPHVGFVSIISVCVSPSSFLWTLKEFSRLPFLLACLLLLQVATAQPHVGFVSMEGDGSPSCCIDAIFNFGNSISDTGNLVREARGTPFATLIGNFPYGESINNPTGRCSDGLLIIDYLATALELPYLQPYLDKSANFSHGVNFAVAGATALGASFFLEKGIILPYTNSSLDVQLRWFHHYLKHFVCPVKEDCSKKLERVLFLVGEIGGNDYNYPFIEGRPLEEVKTYVPQVVSEIVNATEELIHAGAIQLIVPGIFPLGCFPLYLTTFEHQGFAYDARDCMKDFNHFAEFHNQHLQKALYDLRKDHPNVTIIYADYYNAHLNLLDRANNYGFNESSLLKACCGVGGNYNFDYSHLCGSPGDSLCPDPTKFTNWDGIHLTQEAYKDIANQLLSHINLLKRKC